MSQSTSKIRWALESDVERMLEIYAPYVADTPISFETAVPSLQEFQDRFREITKTHPWIVCEIEGKVAGYAYGSPHRTRCVYNWSAEVSVYIASAYHRRNLGRSLYRCLFRILKEQGFYNALGGITLPNPASTGLHEALGFTKVGTYKNIGFKKGNWYDVIWYQLELQSGGVPREPIPVSRLALTDRELESLAD